MSNHLTSEVYRRQLGSMARKAVMVLLADKASDDGSGIWASKQRMAEEIGTTKQTVITTIKDLIKDGLVKEVGQRRCATGFTVEYAIVVRALKAAPLVKCHEEDQSSSLTGQEALPVKPVDGTSQAALPHQSSSFTQTSLEPPLTPKESSQPDGGTTLSVDEIVEGWNDLASRTGLPSIVKLTGTRRRKTVAQAKRFTVDDWVNVFHKIEQSPFCRGQNDRGWRADFNFILSEDSFVKILEGKYDRQPAH